MDTLAFLVLSVAFLALYVKERRTRLGLESQLEARSREFGARKEQLKLELRQEADKQRAAFDSMTEGVMVLDGHERVLLVNRACESLFKIGSDPRGRTAMEATRMPRVKELLERLSRAGRIQDFELDPSNLDGRYVRVNAAKLSDPSGLGSGSVMVFHDLTRTKELENARKEFVANVSHELRTPLSLIKGYTETLIDGAYQKPDASLRFLQIINKHADRLTYLIEDLLVISRLESGGVSMNLSPTPLAKPVAKVCEDLEDAAQAKSLTLVNQVPGDVLVAADSERLVQVLFNLVDNAIKYGARDGEIVISHQDKDERHIVVRVRDNGPGIPEDALERVFERFYRVDQARSREQGGTGLGLAIVKHIVRSHGGDAWAESKPGDGAAFCFTLPKPTDAASA